VLRDTVAVSRWSRAASARKTATAQPIGTSKIAVGAETAVPGGPAGIDEVTVIAKLPASTRITAAWAKCNNVRPRFHDLRLARRWSVTPVATGKVSFLFMATPWVAPFGGISRGHLEEPSGRLAVGGLTWHAF